MKPAQSRVKVLALASYPEEAAATRFRVCQMRGPLAGLGIDLQLRSFLDLKGFESLYQRRSSTHTITAIARGVAKRLRDVSEIRRVDAVLVQREAALLGPPLFETFAARRVPMVLDLDDATWVPYDSPSYGRLARILKWPGKTDWLIRRAAVVTCGSRAVVDHVTQLGADGRFVPTVVDTDCFRPAGRSEGQGMPVVGWIGTHSTFPYLQSILPALRAVAGRHPFRLLIVGSGASAVDVPGAEVRVLDWALQREMDDFQSLDIGLYPLVDDGWAGGKSGFKAVQYMAVGVPFVMTPLGATREMGQSGVTHLEAQDPEDWEQALERLVIDPELRLHMGQAGRAYAESHYTIDRSAKALAAALRDAADGGS